MTTPKATSRKTGPSNGWKVRDMPTMTPATPAMAMAMPLASALIFGVAIPISGAISGSSAEARMARPAWVRLRNRCKAIRMATAMTKKISRRVERLRSSVRRTAE